MALSLDKVDRRILFELDKNARIPDTRLAKLVRRSKESVRHRIKRLQEKGIILGFTAWIDPTRLGFRTAKIYLKLANKPSKKREFVEFIKKDKRLLWLGLGEGSWNAGLTYFIKSNREFFDLKNEIFSKFKGLILDSYTGMLVDVNICDKTFLYDSRTNWTSIFDSSGSYQLDPIEKKILRDLFEDGRINVVDIARRNNTTVDIVRNRIKKLEREKIIIKYLAKINYEKLGYEFFKTFIYFKNLTKTDEERLMDYCKLNPKIIHLVRQISPWDIELEVMCDSYADYNSIISEMTEKFSEIINKIDTAIVGEDYIFPADKMVFE